LLLAAACAGLPTSALADKVEDHGPLPPPRVQALRAVPIAGLLPDGAAGPVLPAARLEIDEAAWQEIDRHAVAWIDQVPLSDGSSVDLRLSRVDPFTADARIVVVQDDGRGGLVEREIERPQLSAWAGEVSGRPGSRAFIARSAAGLHGYIQFDGHTEIISSGESGLGLDPMIADASAMPVAAPICSEPPPMDPADDLDNQAPEFTGYALTGPCRQLPVAVDTDQELLAKFSGNTRNASGYVATLFAAMADIYARDFNIRPSVCYLRWWTTTDPWTSTSTSTQLSQFRTYWNTNMRSTPRSLATLLCGRSLGGGVAWLNATCASTAGSGYGYSVSADLSGSFPYPLQSQNANNWDIIVTSHELGHNMSANHTHDIGVDDCYTASGLGACTQRLQGTIMSYCHLCSGGMSNINLNFDGTNIATVVSYMAGRSCTAPTAALPIAYDDTFTALEGSQILLDVLANDLPANCETISIVGLPATSTLGVPLSIDATGSPSGGPIVRYSPVPGVRGADSFTYQLRDASNQSSKVVTVSIDVQPVLQGFAGLSDHTAGLAARYYALSAPTDIPDFSTLSPFRLATVPSLSFGSTTGSCVGSGQTDNVGAVFEGWIEVPSDGTYAFSLTSDAGSELYLDGVLVIDNGGLHSFSEKIGSIAMRAGLHAVRVRFFEGTGSCGLWLKWAPPGTTTRSLVPASVLSRGGRVNDLDGSGVVDNGDIAFVLVNYGTECPGARCYGDPDDRQYIGLEPCDCPEDLDGSGVIDFGDIAMLLLY